MKKELSDLEQTVLGVIWRDGPCTPYHVRMQFAKSPASHWSGSAGAIYPLIRRLEEAGLLTAAGSPKDKRAGKEYRISSKGKRALDRWLSPPLDSDAASVQFDPLRTRMFFLGAREPEGALSFLGEAARRLEAELANSDSFLKDTKVRHDFFGEIAADGALRVARARLAWIHDAIKRVAEQTPSSARSKK